MTTSICFFCGEEISSPNGNTRESPVIHHINGNHSDNRPENLAWAHLGCHTSYHKNLNPPKPKTSTPIEQLKGLSPNEAVVRFGRPKPLKVRYEEGRRIRKVKS